MPYTPPTDDAAAYRQVVRVTYASADGAAYQASGVLVAANVVLTAGHVVDGAMLSSILVTPGQSGISAPYGSFSATALAWLPGAPADGLVTVAQSQYDIGLIALDAPVGDETGWMALQAGYAGGTVETAGYPASFGGLLERETLPVHQAAAAATLLYPGNSTQAGSSGSPVWAQVDGRAAVVGVVSTTSWAAQITQADLGFIDAFEQQHPAVPATTDDGHGAGAYRLYQAAFDRAPDAAGLHFWTQRLDEGATPLAVAQGFVDSSEFARDFAGTDAAGYVSRLYANVLHRAPDAAGEQFWAEQLSNGASRAQLLLGFADSAENRAAIAAVGHGGAALPDRIA